MISIPLRLKAGQAKTLYLSDVVDRASQGGYRIGGSKPDGKILVEQHIIDRTQGLAVPMYGGGGGYYILNFAIDPVSPQITAGGGTTSIYGRLTWSDYYQEVRCDSMTVSDTQIATLSGSCPKTLTGGYAGATSVKAQLNGPQQGGGTGTFVAQATALIK